MKYRFWERGNPRNKKELLNFMMQEMKLFKNERMKGNATFPRSL